MKSITKRSIGLIFLCSNLSFATVAYAGQVSVAVAGNFFKPIKVLAAQFEAQSGHKVELAVGATGKLYAQISNGAPFELFFAADQRRPSKLIAQQLAVKSSQFTYAQGQLVLWSKNPDVIDAQGKRLSAPEMKRLAIANPKAAPYGEQAVNALKKLGLYQQLQGKLVQGQNIGQTYQYVSSGSVEQGIIAMSQVTVNGQISDGSAWIIPSELYDPIKQDAVLLNKGASNPVAKAFLDYIKSPAAVQIIRSFGYQVDA